MSLEEDELERIAKALATKILNEAETKRVFKESLNEWLDHKFADFIPLRSRYLPTTLS